MEKFVHKIEAETSMGVISAFLGGFAFTMVSDFDASKFSLLPFSGPIYLFLLTTVSALTLGAVLLDATMYFASKRMLAGRMKQSPEQVASNFEAFWSDPAVELTRRLTRDLFIASVPLLLLALSLLLFTKTSGWIALICTTVVFVVIGVCLAVCSKLLNLVGHRSWSFRGHIQLMIPSFCRRRSG